MNAQERFYTEFDTLMPWLCPPYQEFIDIGASAVPPTTRSVCDLGTGTGNFLAAVHARIPQAQCLGIDHNPELLQKAQEKIPSMQVYCQELFSEPLPEAEYFISSLTTHHFDPARRETCFGQIALFSQGFINFDVVLFPGQSIDDVVAAVISHAKQHFTQPETLRMIEEEIRNNDYPAPISEHQEIFEAFDKQFKILAARPPYVVYHAFSSKRKS